MSSCMIMANALLLKITSVMVLNVLELVVNRISIITQLFFRSLAFQLLCDYKLRTQRSSLGDNKNEKYISRYKIRFMHGLAYK